MQVLQLPLREAFSNLTSRDPKKVSFPEGVTKHVTKAAFQNLYLIEYSHLDWDSMWNTWPCVSVTYRISFRLYANDFQIWICQTASSAEYKFTSWLPQVSGLQFYLCDMWQDPVIFCLFSSGQVVSGWQKNVVEVMWVELQTPLPFRSMETFISMFMFNIV